MSFRFNPVTGELDYYSSLHDPVFEGKAVTEDYELTENDFAVGVITSTDDVVITIPTVSEIVNYPRHWKVKKMSEDNNKVIIKLKTPSDSMYGSEWYSMYIKNYGGGVEILLNKNGKYTYSDWSGLNSSALYIPVVKTLQPTLSGTSLNMLGDVVELGAEISLTAKFRYRDITIDDDWDSTPGTTVTSTGQYSETITVTAGHIYEVQAVVVTSHNYNYYGSVLNTDINYYSDINEAMNDKLIRYWAMQETSGTNTSISEIIAGDTMTCYNNVTINSDTINGNTIYKRIFISSAYAQASFQPDWNTDKTILIQIKHLPNSNDHTILNFGRNILSLASDNDDIQLEINNNLAVWSNSTPFTAILNLFITIDRATWKSTLYTATPTNVTERCSRYEIPSNSSVYTRLGRGSSGDANHQDYEYMDNGEVRSIAIWDRVLSQLEMKEICKKLDNDGELIVT